MTWEQDVGWAFVGIGALHVVVNSFSLLASLHPERAAQRGGAGYHKRPSAGSSVARSELWSRVLWGLYFVALGLTFAADHALWSQVVFYVVVTVGTAVWLASRVRRRRQSHPRKSNSFSHPG